LYQDAWTLLSLPASVSDRQWYDDVERTGSTAGLADIIVEPGGHREGCCNAWGYFRVPLRPTATPA
jgi:hypothetical protein